MQRASLARRFVLLAAATLLLGLGTAGPAAAFGTPSGSTMACQYKAAGYTGFGTYTNKNGNTQGYVWDGRLEWQMCVVKNSVGQRYAKVELRSPTAAFGTYDKIVGVFYAYLDTCFPHAYYEQVASGRQDWASRTGPDSTSGGWYHFAPGYTATSSGIGTSGYRVRIETWQLFVVPEDTFSQVIALSPSGWATGPNTQGKYTTGCMAI